MYLRFVLQRSNADSGVRDGFFSAGYELYNKADLSEQAANALGELLKWFEAHLETPERFNRSKSKGYYRRNTRGIAWFKPSADEHVRKAFELQAMLVEHGYAVDVIKTDRPGYVIYEDQHQIVAEPFRDTPV